jgi:capsular polysaccharide biosynthesis protein
MSYYHFLLDVLPRLGVLDQATAVGAPDRWYVPASLGFQRELLEMIGMPPEAIIDSAQVGHVQAETLVVPGLPDAHLKTPPWAVAYLREHLLPASAQRVASRRIYVTRGTRRNTRIVTNETEVTKMLSDRGFTVVEPGRLSVAQQIRTFAEAELIVAPHGGALTNLTFASAGAAVIELFAPDYVQGCYWKLAECIPGLRYRYLVGEGRGSHGGDRMWGVGSDMIVDPASLAQVLEDLQLAPHAGLSV